MFERTVILLPCHSLEDFPHHHDGADADGLLASWTALWHPVLVAAAGQPTWKRVDDPPAQVAGQLIVVPSVSMAELPTGFAQRCKSDGATLVRKKTSREEILAEAWANQDAPPAAVEADLVADFYALGFAYLQMQMLSRQMHYSSRIDEVYFGNELRQAAAAAVAADAARAREHLVNCFQVLTEERQNYYGVDLYLIDLTLVAETTLGASLREELNSDVPKNLLLPVEALTAMAEREPATLEALRAALAAETCSLVGGEAREGKFPLLSPESEVDNLVAGAAALTQLTGKRPRVFGRRRFGLSPQLPAVLSGLGYAGAIHATLDDGRFPEGSQAKIRWEGLGDVALDALARTPRDAASSGTFLSLSTKLYETISSDHVATLLFAHWPGQTSPWYADLRRAARFTPALGKFVTLDDYFARTDHSPQSERFEPDQYKSPYLKQTVLRKQADAISASVRYWQRHVVHSAAQTMSALATLAGGAAVAGDEKAIAARAAHIDRLAEHPVDEAGGDSVNDLDGLLQSEIGAAADRLAKAISPGGGPTGTLVLNPLAGARRINLDHFAAAHLPAVGKPIYAVGSAADRRQVVADVPACGFTWIPAAGPASAPSDQKPIVEEGVLRNEFFEAILNPTSGSLQAIHDYATRGNRLSQQVALRLPAAGKGAGESWSDPDPQAIYSVMAADAIEVTCATPALGELTSRSRLLDREGKLLARLTQRYQLWRGSRLLLVEVELDPIEEPRADPWNSYYGLRFAWASEGAELSRNVHLTAHPTRNKRIEAPLFLDIAEGDSHTTIFPCGLPYHVRSGGRMLDTLLIVRGERARRFRFAIGIDVPHPVPAALGLLAPACTAVSAPPANPSGWLVHVDARTVVVTHLAPLVEQGVPVGFQCRLQETAGRPVKARLSALRAVSEAHQTDLAGIRRTALTCDEGAVKIELAAHQWVALEARW